MAKMHGNGQNYLCLICQRYFSADMIHMHLNTKHHECKTTQVTTDIEEEHYMPKRSKTEEPEESDEPKNKPKKKEHKCPECGQGGLSLKGLRIHVSKKHGGFALERLNTYNPNCKDGKCKLPKKEETYSIPDGQEVPLELKEADKSAIPLFQEDIAHENSHKPETEPAPRKVECPVCHGMFLPGGIRLHIAKKHKGFKGEMPLKSKDEEPKEDVLTILGKCDTSKVELDDEEVPSEKNDTLGAVFGKEAAEVFADAATKGEGFSQDAAKRLTEMYPDKQVKDITLEEFMKVLESLLGENAPKTSFFDRLRIAAAEEVAKSGFDAEKVAADLEAKTKDAPRRHTVVKDPLDVEDELTMRTLRGEFERLNERLKPLCGEIHEMEHRLAQMKAIHAQIQDRMFFIDELIQKTYDEQEDATPSLTSGLLGPTLLMGAVAASALGGLFGGKKQ